MAVLEILKFPDPRLRKKSIEVKQVTDEMNDYCSDMLETMRSFSGIGLSAPQVNRLIRLIVTDTQMKEGQKRYEENIMNELEKAVPQPLFIFNPVIIKKSGNITYDEGCLSLPSYFDAVERFKYIEVEGLDRKGKKICVKTDGLLSICIQHEIDHLDGKLFIDRLSPVKANKIKNKIKKFGYPELQKEEENSDFKEDALSTFKKLPL